MDRIHKLFMLELVDGAGGISWRFPGFPKEISEKPVHAYPAGGQFSGMAVYNRVHLSALGSPQRHAIAGFSEKH